MAAQNSKHGSRKRGKTTTPRAVPSQRRDLRAERMQKVERRLQAKDRTLGRVGDPPPNPFGGVPVSELLILAGIVALAFWLFVGGGAPALIAGIVVLVLGVLEFTTREHFSGYRSHTVLLAAMPAILVAVAAVSISGEKAGNAPLLATAIPVFVLLFFPLRKRFKIARQARIARPPEPPAA
jgi:membrane-bound ClpP family serine protease